MDNTEENLDRTPWLRSRQDELISIIQYLKDVENSTAWKNLKDLVFDGIVESLEKRLSSEAKKDSPNNLEMARINGQLVWAKKYSDLNDLVKVFSAELEAIRKELSN